MYRSVELSPFGILKSKGRTKVWKTSLIIPALGGSFDVVVHGTIEGPSMAQTRMFSKLMDHSDDWCGKVAPKVVEFIRVCHIAPPDIEVTALNVWSFLTPEQIEVHESHQYAHGESELGTNAISIGYLTPWTEEQAIQIPFLNGKIGRIYSE
ncbi:hypothetical protein [Marinobacter daepoensis]|uniref:hypothetical protein n=1 Tax=Marinobacter daepoensis TaxID=262077 RepID=UPI0004A4DC0D|nr:hypothetical protein [Marinobacter daepoensis]